MIVCHKALPNYREGGVVYIEFKTGSPNIVSTCKASDIGVQGGVTNVVDEAKQIKIFRKFQTKRFQNTVVHTSKQECVEPINIPTFLLFPVYSLFIKM